MISAFENMTRMLISKVDVAMASRRPSEQWDAASIRTDHAQVLQLAPNTVDCLQPVWLAKKNEKYYQRGFTGVYSRDVDEWPANGRERKEFCGKDDGVTADHLPNLSKSECSVDAPTSLFCGIKKSTNCVVHMSRRSWKLDIILHR